MEGWRWVGRRDRPEVDVDDGKVLGDTNDGFVASVRWKTKQRLYGRELNENLRVCAESESVGGM
jgi:hypothetical protein